MKNLTKIALVLLTVTAVGTAVLPASVSAKNDDGLRGVIKNFQKGIEDNIFKSFGSTMSNMVQIGHNDDNSAVSASLFFNSNSVRTARNTYNQAVRNANNAYNTARNAARNKFVLAINGSTDQNTRFSAFKTYLSDLLIAIKQRDSAKQTALQVFIDALGNVTINQAPTANSQSVSVTKNSAHAITLTGSDPEASALIFTVLTNPIYGTLSGAVPNLSYLPATNYTGPDSFTFKVNDGSLNSASATVSITVNP